MEILMLLERLQALQQGRLIVAATRGAFRPTTDIYGQWLNHLKVARQARHRVSASAADKQTAF
jgi:hypothetical protein